MSFNSVYRIYRYSCHRLKHLLSYTNVIEFTDFVGECRFSAAVAAASASYTPVNTIILCCVSIPSSARAVCLCLSSFAAEDSEAAQVCAGPFVPAKGLAVAYRITALYRDLKRPLLSVPQFAFTVKRCCISTDTVQHYTGIPHSRNQPD